MCPHGKRNKAPVALLVTLAKSLVFNSIWGNMHAKWHLFSQCTGPLVSQPKPFLFLRTWLALEMKRLVRLWDGERDKQWYKPGLQTFRPDQEPWTPVAEDIQTFYASCSSLSQLEALTYRNHLQVGDEKLSLHKQRVKQHDGTCTGISGQEAGHHQLHYKCLHYKYRAVHPLMWPDPCSQIWLHETRPPIQA